MRQRVVAATVHSTHAEAVKKPSKVVFTLPREETRERLVYHLTRTAVGGLHRCV